MKLTSFLLLLGVLQVNANALAQRITIDNQKMTLTEAFKEIRKQSGYYFIFTSRNIPVDKEIQVNLHDEPVEEALQMLLKGLPLRFNIEDKTILVSEARGMTNADGKAGQSLRQRRGVDTSGLPAEQPRDISGYIFTADGAVLPGATIRIRNSREITQSDARGFFSLKGVDPSAILVVHYLGYITQEIRVSELPPVIRMIPSQSTLDETQVVAYGQTSKRLNTGNVTTISGEDIQRAPIGNPMAILAGRVPGMIVTETNGMPGSAVKIQIRGRTQVDQTVGADESPLFIIDGIPMAGGNENLNQHMSAISEFSLSGLSPFSTISAGDIESIEVLKDADATAIYGSRGARGVVLITTKKGKSGATNISVRSVTGFSKALKPDFLNTQEYIRMRKEAFANDGIEMNATNAYDILVWDTTRNGLVDELIGGTASYTNIDGSISGGTETARYIVGGSYNRTTNVFSSADPNSRGGGYISVSTASPNRKFTTTLRGGYTFTHNQAPSADMSAYLTLPPHFKLYEEDGSLAWNQGGIRSDNPLAKLLETYDAKTSNLTTSALLNYEIITGLKAGGTIGYNLIRTTEVANYPIAAQNPLNAPAARSNFGDRQAQSFLLEPQLSYQLPTFYGNFNALLGGSIQYESSEHQRFTIRDYASDDFLGTLVGVGSSNFMNPSSGDREYKYNAVFGKISYNLNNTYLLNVSGRRDGSSRFGPNYRYSTFGALGAGWIFTNEEAFDRLLGFLSFGKIRGSYGVTGNDQIGDYQYRDMYGSDLLNPTYRSMLALSPTSLFKPDLHWERNQKLELALELGFVNDRFLVGFAAYRERTNDPLVSYPLPYSAGFPSITANLNGVVVQNRGLEFTFTGRNIVSPNFQWRTNFNLTLPENKLLSYPGLEKSSYATRYIIGKPLDIRFLTTYLGIDLETGLAAIEDLNGNGLADIRNVGGDMRPLLDAEPTFYGGMQNEFSYKNISLNLFVNFSKQWTTNWRSDFPGPLGNIKNLPAFVLDRWQQPGDDTYIEKFTTRTTPSTSLNGASAIRASNASYENLFQISLRTVELQYSIPADLIKLAGIKQLNLLLQGQNLGHFTPFRDKNSEKVYINRLAPLRTMVFGLQLGL